jgi:MYXO-CTERM domain-containing protein
MSRTKINQRGVVRVATTAILASLGALLGLGGCSSDEGSGGGERVGQLQQAIACSAKLLCPPDTPCVDWSCNTLTSMCVAKVLIPEGDKCTDPNGQVGACAGGICCSGCYIKNRDGITECHVGTELTRCGQPGTACDNCSGTDTCTQYACTKDRVCGKAPIADKEPCSDNSGTCWQGSCCNGCIDKNEACVPGNTVTQCGQSTAAGLVSCKSCDDGNVCNNDSCQNGVCAAPTPKAGTCNDATVCNGAEVCGGGQCNPGTPLNCNDNNPCTVDTCDAVRGCLNTPVEAGTSCDNDANKCNGTAKCDGTVCKPIAAIDCDDSNICTTDGCTPSTGVCTHTNNTLDCSDNDQCTLVDKCSGGKCVGVGSPNCDDNEACTTDTCVKDKGCVRTPVDDNTACDDGNSCSTNDKCIAGKCSFVMGKDCNDDNPCTIDACSANVCGPVNEANGTPCVFDRCHVNSECQAGDCTQGDPINCDDGNPCTEDTCDGATGCKHTNKDGGDCSDNDLCTTADKCVGGACKGTEITCTALDDCHLAGTCNPRSGVCDDPRAPDETECDGGDGVCQTGKCEPAGSGGAGTGGETGAGGEPTTVGGSGVAQGGEPSVGMGGEGNQPTASAGETGEPGKAGSSSGGSENGEAGSPEVPDRVFVRQPGGCSCSVPGTTNTTDLVWLAGVAVAVGLARRRRGSRAA